MRWIARAYVRTPGCTIHLSHCQHDCPVHFQGILYNRCRPWKRTYRVKKVTNEDHKNSSGAIKTRKDAPEPNFFSTRVLQQEVLDDLYVFLAGNIIKIYLPP